MIYTTHYDSPIGRFLLAEQGGRLVGLWIEGQKYFLGSLKREEMAQRDHSPALCEAKRWLDRYFRGERPWVGELSMNPQGSDFRKLVWKFLCEIPYGQVTTYKEIAGKVAKERGLSHMSAQAVGGAVGHNPISVIVPCHRVVGADGSLTGYAGGIERKRMLLGLEGVEVWSLSASFNK